MARRHSRIRSVGVQQAYHTHDHQDARMGPQGGYSYRYGGYQLDGATIELERISTGLGVYRLKAQT